MTGEGWLHPNDPQRPGGLKRAPTGPCGQRYRQIRRRSPQVPAGPSGERPSKPTCRGGLQAARRLHGGVIVPSVTHTAPQSTSNACISSAFVVP